MAKGLPRSALVLAIVAIGAVGAWYAVEYALPAEVDRTNNTMNMRAWVVCANAS